MKKLFLIAVSYLGLASACLAQSQFTIGPVAGFGHTFVTPDKDWTYQPTWNLGLSATYSPIYWWGVSADVRYSVEGGRTENGNVTTKNTLKYIRVPVKGIFFLRDNEKRLRPKVAIGPSFGFLTGGEYVAEVNNTEFYHQPSKIMANNFDIGVNTSVGLNYRIVEAIWFNFDINYYQGLRDVYPSTITKEMNGNLGLNVGIGFGL